MKLIISLFFISVSVSAYAQNSTIVKESEFIFKEASFKECHASTIESTPVGLIAAWFGGTREKNKDVEIWVSRKEDKNWSKPVSVTNGIQHKDKRYPTWNPVLFQYPSGGPLMLFYKVGPNPSEWWGELKTSGDYGKTWPSTHRLPEDILGPVKNKPVLTQDGRLVSPSSTENNGWQIHFEITSNQGRTWELIGPINDASSYNVVQPSIFNPDYSPRNSFGSTRLADPKFEVPYIFLNHNIINALAYK